MPRPTAPRRPRPVGPAARGGFSLVELVVVVMLLGVLAGVAAPKYRASLQGFYLDAAARQLAADLRRARDTAVQTATPCTLTLEPISGGYRSDDLAPVGRPDQTLVVRFQETAPGVVMTTSGFVADVVTFDWRGETAAAGQALLSAGGRSIAVAVDIAGGVTTTP